MLHHIQEELHAELKLLHQIYFFFTKSEKFYTRHQNFYTKLEMFYTKLMAVLGFRTLIGSVDVSLKIYRIHF